MSCYALLMPTTRAMSRTFTNIRDHNQRMGFSAAVQAGLGRDDGLLMPTKLAPMENLDALLGMDRLQRGTALLQHLIGAEPVADVLPEILLQVLNFPSPLVPLDEQISVLELFHGPSQSFKDFGAGFLIAWLQRIPSQKKRVILTATSGDTGGAVAQAVARLQADRSRDATATSAVILYPQNGVTPEQATFFCSDDSNVVSVAVNGSFDDCQRLVKQAFVDPALQSLNLISANSINVGRLLAQLLYYFDLAAVHPQPQRCMLTIPSGNFGNATAALMSCALGLPFAGVLAVTNENDTVPRFLQQQQWQPQAVQRTISNAMDIALPNNFPRILWLLEQRPELRRLFAAVRVDEDDNRQAICTLAKLGYLAEPHTALAWQACAEALRQPLFTGADRAVVIATAAVDKFAGLVEQILKADAAAGHKDTADDGSAADCVQLPIADVQMETDYERLQALLLRLS